MICKHTPCSVCDGKSAWKVERGREPEALCEEHFWWLMNNARVMPEFTEIGRRGGCECNRKRRKRDPLLPKTPRKKEAPKSRRDYYLNYYANHRAERAAYYQANVRPRLLAQTQLRRAEREAARAEEEKNNPQKKPVKKRDRIEYYREYRRKKSGVGEGVPCPT